MPRSMFTLLLLSAAAVMLQWDCNSATETPSTDMAGLCEVHLQAWFSKTPVTVSIDNSQILADTVTTGSVIGTAKIVPVAVSKGTHLLTVTVAGAISKDTTFTVTDTLYIAVNYESNSSRIDIFYTRTRFMYD